MILKVRIKIISVHATDISKSKNLKYGTNFNKILEWRGRGIGHVKVFTVIKK